MAIHNVKNDNNRVVAHIRTHGDKFVSLTQVRRWTHADARLVATRLLDLVGWDTAPDTTDNEPPLCGECACFHHPGEKCGPFDLSYLSAPVSPVPADNPPADMPPLRGPGSSRAAWVDYARAKGVQVTGTMNREAIAAAVQSREAALSGV